MKKKAEKTSSAKFPMFAFRTQSEAQKNRLEGLVNSLLELYRIGSERLVRKNEVIVEALDRGLQILIDEKNKSNLSQKPLSDNGNKKSKSDQS